MRIIDFIFVLISICSLFRWVDAYGAGKLVSKMEEFASLYGAPFKPAQTLLDMAKDSTKKFHK